jgi:anti-anti-sigma factor
MSDFTLVPLTEHDASPPPIEVRLDRDGTSGYTAVARLGGEHDLTSAVDIQEALGRSGAPFSVDLTACEFIDSTIVRLLMRDHQSRLREGQRLELRVPAENISITRTVAISGLADLTTVQVGYDGTISR